MSEHEKGLMDCLFSRQDMNLENIKFFRGSRDEIADEELYAQAHSADIQRRLGSAKRSSNAPKSKQPKTDVRAFVAKM